MKDLNSFFAIRFFFFSKTFLITIEQIHESNLWPLNIAGVCLLTFHLYIEKKVEKWINWIDNIFVNPCVKAERKKKLRK